MSQPPSTGQSTTIPGAAVNDPAEQLPLNQRIMIIDVLRGVALLGILLMNIPYFALPENIASDLRVRDEFSGINYYTWWIINGIFEGTMRGIFSMLFGAGTVVLLYRLERKHTGTYPADIYYRRLIWLLIFGLINAFLFLWVGDILYSYAICGLLLFPFRKLAPRYLVMFGVGLMLILNVKNTLDLYNAKDVRIKGEAAIALDKKKDSLTEDQKNDKVAWEGRLERMKPENMKKEADKKVKEYRKGYFSLMAYLKDTNVMIQTRVFYHNYFWDVLAFFFFGMALYKWDVLTGKRSAKFYLTMAIVGYAIGLPLNYISLDALIEARFDYSLIADKQLIDFYDERRLFLCLGHIGLIILIYKLQIAEGLYNLLAKVGQMAFTNYLMQSLICGFIFNGYGLRWFGALERYQIYYIVFGVWIFQIIFSSIWLTYFRLGPFEWLWRSLTYWQKYPMKKREVASQSIPVPAI